jgi:hypothetical protein
VGLLTLYFGLLLPWVGGTFWLILADSRFNDKRQISRFRQTGYGFFLGYAILFLAVMTDNKLTGSVSWVHLISFLLIFSISGGIAAWLNRKPARPSVSVTGARPGISVRVITVAVSILMAIHLIFIAVEIFTQPVYPWDAWLAWVYRAKTWFLAGNMVDIVSTSDWITASSTNIYTIDAFNYPLFPSVVPYWAAISLGYWSETLVNLPVLFAGLAIGMALYGQCREHGLTIFTSLITCYLLYSIPLLGTHLALAGYADIWMAGFNGLGFVAVLRGAMIDNEIKASRFHITLGLLMILFSVWIKNEGAVWLLAAIALLVLAKCRPRVPIIIASAALIVTLITFLLGYTYIAIPLIGKLGIVDGRLAIPVIGNFGLEMHNVGYVYWNNFIQMGSWNLLWVAVVASLLLAMKSPNPLPGYRIRRTALSFILLFLASQLFIFGFTDKGLWADTYTAINRLPLHFVPALLFVVVVVIHSRLKAVKVVDTGTEANNGEA